MTSWFITQISKKNTKSEPELAQLNEKSCKELVEPVQEIIKILQTIKTAQEEEPEKPLYLEARHSETARLIVNTLSKQLTKTVHQEMISPAFKMAGYGLVNDASEYL